MYLDQSVEELTRTLSISDFFQLAAAFISEKLTLSGTHVFISAVGSYMRCTGTRRKDGYEYRTKRCGVHESDNWKKRLLFYTP